MGGEISGTYLDIASRPAPERKTRSKQPSPPPRARRPPDSVPKRRPPPERAPKPPEDFAPAPPPRARRQDGNGSAPLERKGVLAVHGVEKTFVGRKVVKGVSLYVRKGEAVGRPERRRLDHGVLHDHRSDPGRQRAHRTRRP
jgi:lipopolysaccharide export system ATP-binding protein